MQKFADAPLAVHDRCGGPVHRLLSAPALQFKGSGWYITDYARGSGKSSKSGEGKSEAAGKSEPAKEKATTSSSESSKPTSS